MIFGPGSIVWFGWAGIALLRTYDDMHLRWRDKHRSNRVDTGSWLGSRPAICQFRDHRRPGDADDKTPTEGERNDLTFNSLTD